MYWKVKWLLDGTKFTVENAATRAKLLAGIARRRIELKMEDLKMSRYKYINAYTGEIETRLGMFKSKHFKTRANENEFVSLSKIDDRFDSYWVPIKYYNACQDAIKLTSYFSKIIFSMGKEEHEDYEFNEDYIISCYNAGVVNEKERNEMMEALAMSKTSKAEIIERFKGYNTKERIEKAYKRGLIYAFERDCLLEMLLKNVEFSKVIA